MALPISPWDLTQQAKDYLQGFGINPGLIVIGSIDDSGYSTVQWGGEVRAQWPGGFDYQEFLRLDRLSPGGYLPTPKATTGSWGSALFHEDEVAGVSEVPSDFASKVLEKTDAIAEMLVAKNEAYGNAALDPVRTFSKASAEEQLLVRIDDKLSRIQRGTDYADEDTVADLIGYLILLQIARDS